MVVTPLFQVVKVPVEFTIVATGLRPESVGDTGFLRVC